MNEGATDKVDRWQNQRIFFVCMAKRRTVCICGSQSLGAFYVGWQPKSSRPDNKQAGYLKESPDSEFYQFRGARGYQELFGRWKGHCPWVTFHDLPP